MGTSACPHCGQLLSTPSLLDMKGWSSLACPACKKKLKLHYPRRSNSLLLFGIALTLLAQSRLDPRWLNLLLLAVGLIFSLSALVFLILESRRPKLRLKALPRPEVVLNLHNPR